MPVSIHDAEMSNELCRVVQGLAMASIALVALPIEASECRATISEIANEIRVSHNVAVDEIRVRVADNPRSPYANANQEVVFVLYERPNQQVDRRLRGYSHNLMNSQQLLLAMSKRLIDSCEPVFRVRFGLNHTDGIRDFVINENGVVSEVH